MYKIVKSGRTRISARRLVGYLLPAVEERPASQPGAVAAGEGGGVQQHPAEDQHGEGGQEEQGDHWSWSKLG